MYAIVTGMMVGLALFIYGITLLTNALNSLSLNKIREVLAYATNNRFKGFALGVVVTAIVQSSSTVSVVLIGFLNVGAMTLVNAIPVVFGANIGTTMTAQLIAFNLTKIAPLLVTAGVIIFMLAKKRRIRNLGIATLGFGLIFFGINVMSAAVKPLANDPAILGLFSEFGANPLLGVLLGLVITIMFQSSSATIGMLIALAISGLIDFRSAFFIVLGDNIGTCSTAVIASLGGSRAGKRLAVAHTLFNVFGTILALIFAPLYLKYAPLSSPDIARQIANVHTAFNVINNFIFLPLVPQFASLAGWFVRGEDYCKKEVRSLDKHLIGNPSQALNAAREEMVRMLDTCREMLGKTRTCMETFNHKVFNEVMVDEESVDDIQRQLSDYIVEVSSYDIEDEDLQTIPFMLNTINDIEKIGDYCQQIMRSFEKRYEYDYHFNKDALQDLDALFNRMDELLGIVGTVIAINSESQAVQTLDRLRKERQYLSECRMDHVKRLRKRSCKNEPGLVYTDLLMHFDTLMECMGSILRGTVEQRQSVRGKETA